MTPNTSISESTVARIAGNIAASMVTAQAGSLTADGAFTAVAKASVFLARAIVADVARTHPQDPA